MAPCVVRGMERERGLFPRLCCPPAPAQAVVRWCKFLADPGPGPGPANHRALGWAGLGWAAGLAGLGSEGAGLGWLGWAERSGAGLGWGELGLAGWAEHSGLGGLGWLG